MIYFAYDLTMLSEEGKIYNARGVVGAGDLPSAAAYIHNYYEDDGYAIISSYIIIYDESMEDEEEERRLLN